MKTKLIRISRADMDHHKSMPEIEGIPIYYCYEPGSGFIEIWPPDNTRKCQLSIIIEEQD